MRLHSPILEAQPILDDVSNRFSKNINLFNRHHARHTTNLQREKSDRFQFTIWTYDNEHLHHDEHGVAAGTIAREVAFDFEGSKKTSIQISQRLPLQSHVITTSGLLVEVVYIQASNEEIASGPRPRNKQVQLLQLHMEALYTTENFLLFEHVGVGRRAARFAPATPSKMRRPVHHCSPALPGQLSSQSGGLLLPPA